ncbi:MAG: thioesterase family protein [Pseudomonadota bacterium]
MNDSQPASFERDILIRFAHCDPAGIVFFPQYLVLFNGLVEDWFDQCLEVGYAHFLGERRLGLPIVKLDCEFKAPSKMGDHVTLALMVSKLGRSSLALEFSCRSGDELRVVSRQVLVTTSLENHKAIPVPDDVRARIERFQTQT